jgi:hypothetical protein
MKKIRRYYPYGDYFVEEVQKANQFLLDINCKMEVALSEWQASVKYRNDDLLVIHQFGDREIVFESIIGTARCGYKKYGLWEWKDALGDAWPTDISSTIVCDGIDQKNKLRELIISSANFIQANLDEIINTKRKVKRNLERNRKKRVEELRNQGFVVPDS